MPKQKIVESTFHMYELPEELKKLKQGLQSVQEHAEKIERSFVRMAHFFYPSNAGTVEKNYKDKKGSSGPKIEAPEPLKSVNAKSFPGASAAA